MWTLSYDNDILKPKGKPHCGIMGVQAGGHLKDK